MAGKKRKKHEEEQENNERWLVSYADFITLLFAFFVTMYAISRVDGQKLGSAVESLQRALGSVVAVQSTQRNPGVFPANMPQRLQITPIDGGKGYPSKEEIENFEKLVKGIQTKMQGLSQQGKGKEKIGDIGKGDIAKGDIGKGDIAKGDTGKGLEAVGNDLKSLTGDQIKFIIEKRGLVIRVSDRLFFESGDASIRPDFIPMLNVLVKAFENIPNHIRIEGHTDSVPINTSKFPSNWELSTARATTIIRYFLANFNLKQERLSATGYAEFHPIESNRAPEGRLQNRRVDFVVLSNKEMDDEPQAPSPFVKPSEKVEPSTQDPV
jgi:chemotaxis protein MotB